MDTLLLKEWAAKHQILERTMDGFWYCFETWKKECGSEYDDLLLGQVDECFIELVASKLQLVHMYDYMDLISCKVRIKLMEQDLGYYEMEFKMNGEVFDDYLVWDDKDVIRAFVLERKSMLDVANRSLEAGLDLDLISKITNINNSYIKLLSLNRNTEMDRTITRLKKFTL